MKRPFLGAGLILVSLGLASAGCSQTGTREVSSKSKPADPTSWSERDLSSSSSSPSSSSFSKSSSLTGGWSSESRDIERSLGVGQ